MANAKELLDFVHDLEDRGMLAKSTREFDYEQLIWQYLAPTQNKGFGLHVKPSDSPQPQPQSIIVLKEI